MKKDIEELKKTYPRLWERACKKFKTEKGREKGFLAFIEVEKAKLKDLVEREKERKRRTRALILFSSSLIRTIDAEQLKELIELVKNNLKAKEGKQQLDYLPYLIEEIKQYHFDFKFEPETKEEPETEEAVAEEAVPSVREEVKRKLETEFEKVVEKVFEED